MTGDWFALDATNPTVWVGVGSYGVDVPLKTFAADKVGDVEKIRISYNDLYIEADITLADGRPQVNIAEGTIAAITYDEKTASNTLEEAVKAAVAAEGAYTVTGSNGSWSTPVLTVNTAELPTQAGVAAQVTVTITVDENENYQKTTKDVKVSVTLANQPSSLTSVSAGDGSGSVKFYSDAEHTNEISSSLAGTVYFVVTPNNGDGSYVNSVAVSEAEHTGAYNGAVYSGQFTVESNSAYTVTVTYGNRNFNPANGQVKINGYYEKAGDAKAFEAFEKDVLTAAGLDPNGDYTVNFVYRLGNINISDGISDTDRVALCLAIETLPENRSFQITLNAAEEGKLPAVTKTVTMQLVESRSEPTIAHSGDTYVADALDEALLAAIEEDLTVNGNAVDVGLTWAANQTLAEEGQSGNVTVLVSVAETADYVAVTEKEVVVSVKNQQHLSTLTISDGTGYTITVQDSAGNNVTSGTKVGSGIYTMTIAPATDDGYYVVMPVVNGEDYYGDVSMGAGCTYTTQFSVTNGATKEIPYTVSARVAQRQIVGKQADSYVYQVQYKPDMTDAELAKAVYDAVVDTAKSSYAPADAPNYTVTVERTLGQQQTVTITYPGDTENNRYAAVSAAFQVTLTEGRVSPVIPTMEQIAVKADLDEVAEAVRTAILTQNTGLTDVTVTVAAGETEPSQGAADLITVTIVTGETDTYAPLTTTLDVSVIGAVTNATVSIGETVHGTVAITHADGTAIADDTYPAGDYIVTLTPDEGYFVDSLVIGTQIPLAEIADGKYELTIKDGTGSALGECLAYSIKATFVKPAITIEDGKTVTYYVGQTTENLVEDIIYKVDPETTPIDLLHNDQQTIVEYLARPAGEYTFTINVPYLGARDITVSLGDIWLEIDEPFPEFVMPNFTAAEITEIIKQLGTDFDNITLEQLQRIAGLENIEYAGAHEFGAADTETIRITSTSDRFGEVNSNTAVITLEDDRVATELRLNEGVEMTYGFNEAELMAAILDGVYADGAKIDAEVKFVTNVNGISASEDAQTVKVRFAGTVSGDVKYQDCEAETTIIVNKAPCEVAVGDAVVRYGTDYELDVTTSPTDLNTITFIAGIDLANVDVNMDGSVVGLMGEVILILPDELLTILEPYIGSDGASMTVSELQTMLTEVADALALMGVSNDIIDTLIDTLQKLPTEVADLEIVIGGKPTDFGAYLVGSISADSNYETDIGAGYLVITPDGKKVELTWNVDDENGIITLPVIQSGAYDLGAHVTKVYEGTIEEAQEQVLTLFLGVDEEGNMILTANQKALTYGAYTEVALMSEFGNTMYYAEPLIRAFIVTPTPIDVQFVDETGEPNNDRVFEFDNEPHALAVEVNGAAEGYTGELTIQYYGVQSNTELYDSETAPTRAGVYTAIATYIERDENGEITGLGMDVAAIVIMPTESTIEVDNAYIVYGVDESVNADSLVTAGSTVEGIVPDTTVITAMLKDSADFSEDGLAAIEGVVNVDFPAWLDTILKEHVETLAPAYDGTGVEAGDVVVLIEAYKSSFEELGVSTETINALISVLAQIPDNLKLTCLDDVAISDVGAYLVVGIVTDSDHVPSVDAGIVLVVPNTVKAELEYIQNWNDNNIFTLDSIKSVDMGAQAYLDGALSEELTALVKNLYISVDPETLEIKLYDDQAELSAGIYTEVSYLLQVDANPLYYAEPISRVFVVVPNAITVEFHDETGVKNHDRKFTYDNTAHSIGEVVVTDTQGNAVDTTKGELKIVYIGTSTGVEPYFSESAPTHAGAYTVIATYVEYDENGSLLSAGSAVGALVIEPAEAEVNVDSQVVVAGSEYDLGVTVSSDVENDEPKTVTIMAGVDVSKLDAEGMGAINTNINVDFPERVDEVLETVVPALYSEDGISSADFLKLYDEAVDAVEAAGIEAEVLAQLKSILEQMPNRSITAQQTEKPVEIGAYLIFSMVFDPDYKSAMDIGLLVITPDVVPGKLSFNQEIPGLLNILPSEAVADFDFGVSGTEYGNDGSESAMDSAKISNVIIGITNDGELFFGNGENTPTEMGVYDQVGYVADSVDEDWYMIVPVLRTITIVKSTADVVFYDENGNPNYLRKFTYDGTAKEMKAVLEFADGAEVEGAELTVRYVGITANGEPYNSAVAPSQVGVYDVVAYCIDPERNIYAMGTGALYIEKRNVTVSVDDETITVGDEIPTGWNVTYTPALVEGDSLDITVTCNGDNMTVGAYEVTVSVEEHPNYNITVENGTLTVVKAITGEIIDTGRTLSLDGVIYINQYVKVKGFEGVDVAGNGGMLVWDQAVTEDEAVVGGAVPAYVQEGLIVAGDEYMQRTTGIAAKEYADVVYLRVYVQLPDGSYAYGPLKEFSVRHYCEARINADAKEKDVCIAMLHYGASAQEYFDYNLEDPANKNVVETYPSVEWDATLINALDPFTTSITASSSVSNNGRTLSLDGAIVVNCYYGFTGDVKSAELLVWDGVTEELTAENASYSVNMKLVGNEYWAQSREFASKEYGKTVYVCAHFVDENGEDHYSDVVAFSPEEYARRVIANYSNPELLDVVKKMVIYGEFARIYFEK